MADDILSEYGPGSKQPQAARATNGGQMEKKDLAYDPPKGPMGQMHEGVGLGGTNHGCCGTQGKH